MSGSITVRVSAIADMVWVTVCSSAITSSPQESPKNENLPTPKRIFQVRTLMPPPWYAFEFESTLAASNLFGVDKSGNSTTNGSQPFPSSKRVKDKRFFIILLFI